MNALSLALVLNITECYIFFLNTLRVVYCAQYAFVRVSFRMCLGAEKYLISGLALFTCE